MDCFTFRKISLGHISTNEDPCLGNIQENPHVSEGLEQREEQVEAILAPGRAGPEVTTAAAPLSWSRAPIPEPRASSLLPENSWETRSGLCCQTPSKRKMGGRQKHGQEKMGRHQRPRAWLGNETGAHLRASRWHAQSLGRSSDSEAS